MTGNKEHGFVTLRLFGSLRPIAKERGFPDCLEKAVPHEGKTGVELAAELEIPKGRIEAVFRNGVIQDLEKKIFPGDRVAFVPPGTPGPYRVLLGMVGGKKPDTP
jgi:molybdopterin converting factor small subunit